MMNYRILGRTGLKVSVLGFGCMRLPLKGDGVDDELAIPLLRRAVELGINYFDSAVFYCGGDSQRAMGDALHDLRDKIFLATKNNYYSDADGWWRNLETSLRLMRTDHLDVYHFHGMSWERYLNAVKPHGLIDAMLKARDQGMIRHLAYSCHDTAENSIKIAEEGAFESCLMQYSLLDRKNEPAIARLNELGMGVAVMGPVAGGRLANQKMGDGAEAHSAEIAFKFVWSNPAVDIALSGMSTMEMLEQNVAVASQDLSLSSAELEEVASAGVQHEKLLDLYCTSCGYCMPCPAGVNIPENFTLAHLDHAYGMTELAQKNYASLKGKARYCVECGKCLDHCPQNLQIPTQLAEIVQRLDKELGKPAMEAYITSAKPVDGGMEFQFTVGASNLTDQPLSAQLSLDLSGHTLLDQTLNLKGTKSRQFKVQHLATPASIKGPVRYRAILEGTTGTPEITQDYPLLFAHRFTPEDKAIADQAYVCGPKRVVAGDKDLCATHRFGFRIGNDGTNLIVLADVEDDHLNAEEDGVEVFFDCRQVSELRGGAYSKNCGYARLIAGDNPRLEPKYVLNLDFAGSVVTASNRKGGYSLKAKIPLSGLIRNEGQHLIGFDIHQVSHDQAGALQIHLAWNGNERSRKFTPGFGLLFVE